MARDRYQREPTSAMTIVVAASNSSPIQQAQADFLCTGTNDEVQIQAAIDSLPSHGGKIYLLSGRYYISSQISTTQIGLTIEGESCGYGNSTMKGTVLEAQTGLSSAGIIKILSGSSSMFGQVKNLVLDGNSQADTYGLELGWDCIVKNCSMHHCTSGLLCEAKGRVFVSNNWFEDNLYGITSGYDMFINNNIFSGNTNSDLRILSTSHRLMITDNRFDGASNSIATIRIISGVTVKDLLISNNVFRDQAADVIQDQGATISNMIVSNNSFDRVTGSIYHDTSASPSTTRRCKIINNVIDSNGLTDFIFKGAHASSKHYNFEVSGNIADNFGSGISVEIADTKIIQTGPGVDTFINCIAADDDRIVTIIALDTFTPGDFASINAQPDVPRNITFTVIDANTSATWTFILKGIDSTGVERTENFTQASGLTQSSNYAYKYVESFEIDIISGEDATIDTLIVGVGDVLGLSGSISHLAAVSLVTENNAVKAFSAWTANATYNIVKMDDTDAIVNNDDFGITFTKNLNTSE